MQNEINEIRLRSQHKSPTYEHNILIKQALTRRTSRFGNKIDTISSPISNFKTDSKLNQKINEMSNSGGFKQGRGKGNNQGKKQGRKQRKKHKHKESTEQLKQFASAGFNYKRKNNSKSEIYLQ